MGLHPFPFAPFQALRTAKGPNRVPMVVHLERLGSTPPAVLDRSIRDWGYATVAQGLVVGRVALRPGLAELTLAAQENSSWLHLPLHIVYAGSSGR